MNTIIAINIFGYQLHVLLVLNALLLLYLLTYELELIFSGPNIFIIAIYHNHMYELQLRVIIAIHLSCIKLLQLNELMSIIVFYCN